MNLNIKKYILKSQLYITCMDQHHNLDPLEPILLYILHIKKKKKKELFHIKR